jgi:hypothetical protein
MRWLADKPASRHSRQISVKQQGLDLYHVMAEGVGGQRGSAGQAELSKNGSSTLQVESAEG